MNAHQSNLNHFVFITLFFAISSGAPSSNLSAQTFKVLHTFSGGTDLLPWNTNTDGVRPQDGLILSGNTLYGTAAGGGAGGGTVFAVNTDGSDFRVLHSFSALANGNYGQNNDGGHPRGRLVLYNNTLYGTTADGGSSGRGTLFQINPDGTGFATLHTLTSAEGSYPNGDLILSGTTLYGTAWQGGSGYGSVFSFDVKMGSFSTLYSFTGLSAGNDGGNPLGGLVLISETLYGTTADGGGSGEGTVFAINTDGSGFTGLYGFGFAAYNQFAYLTNEDGAGPYVGLVSFGDTLYGATANGSTSGLGTLFSIKTDGTSFRTLHSFGRTGALYTNIDGAVPMGPLILSGSTLYGTANVGGSAGNGTVFALNTDGTGFRTIYNFGPAVGGTNSDGAGPQSALLLSGDTLYGVASFGGSSGNGTVFSISLVTTSPQLNLTTDSANVILSWPAQVTSFALQFSTNLLSSRTWTTVSTPPVVINGQNTVTNPISSTQQFYRLINSSAGGQ